MQNLALGSALTPEDQRHVLAAYPYRNTVENVAARPGFVWASYAPGRCPAPTMTDAQWLAATEFAVRKNGRLDLRSKHCLSHRL